MEEKDGLKRLKRRMDQRMEEKDGSKNGGEGVTNRLKENYGMKGWIKEKNEKDGEKG